MSNPLHPSARAQFELELCGCASTQVSLEREAHGAGSTGAGIDAALTGRSFEAPTAALLAYARVLVLNEPQACERGRKRADKMGVGAVELVAVARATDAAQAGASQ